MVVTTLIDMYAKCGIIHKAQELFEKMHDANSFMKCNDWRICNSWK